MPDPIPEWFVCERCQQDCDDLSFQPLCPDCAHETGAADEEADD